MSVLTQSPAKYKLYFLETDLFLSPMSAQTAQPGLRQAELCQEAAAACSRAF